MSETEHVLIGRVALSATQNGKPIADLFSTDTRLQFPVLRLFDVGALLDVGIDPTTLTHDGQACRFRAYYTVSTKLNSQGVPYKDVAYLERTTANIPAPLPDLATNLARLVRLVELIATHLQVDIDAPTNPTPKVAEPPEVATPEATDPVVQTIVDAATGELKDTRPPHLNYHDGSHVGPSEAEQLAFSQYMRATTEIPRNVDVLRAWVLAQPQPDPK